MNSDGVIFLEKLLLKFSLKFQKKIELNWKNKKKNVVLFIFFYLKSLLSL